jgi:hypothetical protein
LYIGSRTPELSQAFVEIVAKPNLEAVRIVLWFQTQQVQDSDIVKGSIRKLSVLAFLPVLEIPTRSKRFDHRTGIMFSDA